MSEPLYQRCPVCDGSRVHTWPSEDGGSPPLRCPCNDSATPGWALVGVTVGQLDRMADLERTLAGDPGIPQPKRAAILAHVRARLGLLDERGYFKQGVKGETLLADDVDRSSKPIGLADGPNAVGE